MQRITLALIGHSYAAETAPSFLNGKIWRSLLVSPTVHHIAQQTALNCVQQTCILQMPPVCLRTEDIGGCLQGATLLNEVQSAVTRRMRLALI